MNSLNTISQPITLVTTIRGLPQPNLCLNRPTNLTLHSVCSFSKLVNKLTGNLAVTWFRGWKAMLSMHILYYHVYYFGVSTFWIDSDKSILTTNCHSKNEEKIFTNSHITMLTRLSNLNPKRLQYQLHRSVFRPYKMHICFSSFSVYHSVSSINQPALSVMQKPYLILFQLMENDLWSMTSSLSIRVPLLMQNWWFVLNSSLPSIIIVHMFISIFIWERERHKKLK